MLPLAPRTRPWDAAAARSRILSWANGDRAKYAKAFLYDSRDDSTVTSSSQEGIVASDFKLPIADVIGGKLTAVPRAIFAAASAISGSRGGLKISEAAKKNAKATLTSYYKKMKQESPWTSKESDDEFIDESVVENDEFDSESGESVVSDDDDDDAVEFDPWESETGEELDAVEVKGSSVKGHDPRADKRPLKNLVDSFGKWAKGKQATCVRVLETHHPELCSSRPGGCNGLCAYMKDQWMHTTKWRTGHKKGKEAYMTLESGEVIHYDGPILVDMLAYVEESSKEGFERPQKPEWLTDEEMMRIAKALESIAEPVAAPELIGNYMSSEELAYDEITQKVSRAITDQMKANSGDRWCWCYIEQTYDTYVIYSESGCYYKQDYKITKDDTVELVGSPLEMRKTFEPVKSPSKTSKADPEYAGNGNNMSAPVYSGESSSSEQPRSRYWNGIKVLVDSEGKIVDAPKYLSIVGEDFATSEAKEKETYISVSTDKGIVSVRVNKETGLITEGPKSLLGMYLPVPIPTEATTVQDESRGESVAVASGDSNSIVEDGSSVESESENITEEDIQDAITSFSADTSESEWMDYSFDSVVMEAAEVGKKIKTPSGKEVDAIIRVISPGKGNSRTNFYYPKKAIKSTLSVFEGKKMYKDHLLAEDEKKYAGSPRRVEDWVSTVKEIWVDESGTGFAGIDYVDKNFQTKTRLGKDDIGVSINGRVSARRGKVRNQQVNIVEAFTLGKSIDWVTEAGARGGLVSIAQEGNTSKDTDMGDLSDLTLEQLQEARPDLLTAHAKLLAEGEEGESTESVLESADIQKIVSEAVASAVASALENEKKEVKESLVLRDKKDNRRVLESMLNDSGLKPATIADLKAEFFDMTCESEVDADGKIVKDSEEVFKDRVSARIEQRKAEIAEYTKGRVTTVINGPSGTSVIESDAVGTESKGTPYNDMIRTRMGLRSQTDKVPAPSTVTEGGETE